MTSLISIEQLKVTRGDAVICDVPQLQIEKGQCWGISGINGSGKSTLLRALAGLESDFTGNIMCGLSTGDIGFVQQRPYLFRGTVTENILYGMRSGKIAQSEAKQLARSWMQQLDILPLADRRSLHLSGGERRRVALARTLIRTPKLLLLDEPFADLDETGMQAVVEILQSLNETTILITSPGRIPETLQTDGHFVLQ